MSWPVDASRKVYANPWITVREDTVIRPDGATGIYGVVTLAAPAVFVVALTDDDEVVLVTVDRHTVGPSVEVPAGGTDGQPPLEAAQRELAEETGLTARSWRRVGTMQALNGICEAPEIVYLATGLAPLPTSDAGSRAGSDAAPSAPPDAVSHATSDAGSTAWSEAGSAAARAEEGISEVRLVPVPAVLRMVASGEITDCESIAALLHALIALGRVG